MLTALLAAALAAGLPANATFGADGSASTVRYSIVHKLHRVDGQAGDVQAKAIAREDGTLVAQVRIPVASFRSGDGNRDLHMLETMEAGKHPFVAFKGLARLGAARDLPVGPLRLEGELDLHGVRRPLVLTLRLTPLVGGGIRVQGSFDVSLEAHAIERPALLFVKVDDLCHIDLDVVMRPEPR